MRTFLPFISRIAVIGFLALVAPATAGDGPASERDPAHRTQAKLQRDRQAILDMAGAFRVSFRFEETAAIEPGYELKPVYETGAIELVEVIADEGDFISLQHVLVVEDDETGEPRVVKHWRQDWRYEDTRVLAYRGDRTWEAEARTSAEVEGTWTQAVFQTTDAPRYEAVGRWTHLGERSAWESEPIWRPLPRREYTKRDDYDVLACRNRHTVTPDGWLHEQDNQKLVLHDDGEPKRIIAHEVGLNRYERIDEDPLEPAAEYWDAHADAWADVRAAWARLLDRERVRLRFEVDGTPIYKVVNKAIEDPAARGELARRLAAYVE
jgi:hypothetical protein